MTRRRSHSYKPPPRRRRRASPSQPRRRGWGYVIVFILGIALGVVMTRKWLLHQPTHAITPVQHHRHIPAHLLPAAKHTPSSSHQPAQKKTVPPPLQFDFYTILPQRSPHAYENFPKKQQHHYFLRASSLFDKGQLNTLRARLSLLGFNVTVKAEKLSDQVVKYRVWIGPYANLSIARSEQRRLLQANVHSQVLRANKG